MERSKGAGKTKITRLKPDIALARKKLGWDPKFPFREGLLQTTEYFRNII
jgi:nucleoside-diphosphate-sugar epimerase